MQKARRHPDYSGLRPLVSVWFQVLFTPLLGVLSPFPHGTGSLSVFWEYLALPDGAGKFTQSFTGFVLLRIPALYFFIRIPDYHLLWFSFPN